MLNQVVVVGRIKKIKEDGKFLVLTLKVPNSFKNSDGIYEDNFIDCHMWEGIKENVKKYCNNEDLIGIKGRIERIEMRKKMRIIAEKVTFLSSNKEEK